MALATTCPQCKTSFKVVPDQLKLRRGLVRCGVCQHVFSGIDYLRYVDEATGLAHRPGRPSAAAVPPPGAAPEPLAAPALPAPPPAPSLPDWSETTTRGPQTVIDPNNLKTAFFLSDSLIGPLSPEGVPTRIVPQPAPPSPDLLAGPSTRQRRRSAPNGSILAPRSAKRSSPLERADNALPTAPQPDLAFDLLADAPRPRLPWRLKLARSPRAWAAAGVLAAVLVLQALHGWRDTLAAHVPGLAPVLGALMAPFGVALQAPRDLGAMTIESFELQTADAPNVLTMQAVLRNQAHHPVGFPAMELTLTDTTGRLLVRKVIPVDVYLQNDPRASAGLAAGAERPVKLAMEHDGLEPAGFSVALFYP